MNLGEVARGGVALGEGGGGAGEWCLGRRAGLPNRLVDTEILGPHAQYEQFACTFLDLQAGRSTAGLPLKYYNEGRMTRVEHKRRLGA